MAHININFTENDTIKFDLNATTQEALQGTGHVIAEYIFNAVKETGDETLVDHLFQELLLITATRYNELASQANEEKATQIDAHPTQPDNVITIDANKLAE